MQTVQVHLQPTSMGKWWISQELVLQYSIETSFWPKIGFSLLVSPSFNHYIPFYMSSLSLIATSSGADIRNCDKETSEMEITIREICKGRYRCSINRTRIYLSTKKMAQWVSPCLLILWRESRRKGKEVRADERSIFAAVYAMVCFWRIWTSGHGFVRKIMLNLITIYSASPRILCWLWEELTNRLNQFVIQLALCLFVLSGFLLPHWFFDLYRVRPVRWSWGGYFRRVQ